MFLGVKTADRDQVSDDQMAQLDSFLRLLIRFLVPMKLRKNGTEL